MYELEGRNDSYKTLSQWVESLNCRHPRTDHEEQDEDDPDENEEQDENEDDPGDSENT